MKIAHISDLHLTEKGKIIWDTDILNHFNKMLTKLHNIEELDAIIITGDISNDGSKWTYEYLDNALAEIGVPTYCIPGNHDSLSMFYQIYKPHHYSTCKRVIMNDWKFLFLNSVMQDKNDLNSNMSRGYITREELDFIDKELDDEMPTCLCLHHPPLEPGGWLNRKLLDNRNEFNNLIAEHSNARCILYGHIHYCTQRKISQTMYISASSTAFAFDKDLPKFEIAQGSESFNIITLDKNITIEKIFIL